MTAVVIVACSALIAIALLAISGAVMLVRDELRPIATMLLRLLALEQRLEAIEASSEFTRAQRDSTRAYQELTTIVRQRTAEWMASSAPSTPNQKLH